jgi:hypothetical protein
MDSFVLRMCFGCLTKGFQANSHVHAVEPKNENIFPFSKLFIISAPRAVVSQQVKRKSHELANR